MKLSDRYTLDREVGRGGMGAVWQGRDELLGRTVAIKRIGVLPGDTHPDLIRAEREARVAARVNHPHVVAIFDLIDDGDQQYIVMEYVDGTTLAELIQSRGPLSPDEVAPLLAQGADALAASHDAGVVHRDVKPSNFLVTPDGQVKLSDFGIARAEADAALTQTGLITGSPSYIAPEVASGQQASPASDVWSLGATAFHALSGKAPYEVTDNVLGTLYRIVHDAPPRSDRAGWLGPLLEGTMTREPQQRWSMAQVREFLTSQARPEPIETQQFSAVDLAGGLPPPPVSAPPEPAPEPAPEPMREPVPLPESAATGASPHAADRRSSLLLPLVLVAALALAVVVGVLLVTGGGDDETAGGPASSGPGRTQQSQEPSSPPSSTSPSATASPDAAEMVGFTNDYLALASSDPSAGFRMLTPAYQRASDGLASYRAFWGKVEDLRLVDGPRADPQTLSVDYTYSYRFRGERRRERVQLQLEFRNGTYLIAGAQTL